MCGEKPCSNQTWSGIWGSPPHVRGKDVKPCKSHPKFGITPACAGKRQEKGLACLKNRDHPRMCGEKTSKALKHKHLHEAVLKFLLTSDRSHRSTGSSSVLPMPLYPLHPDYSGFPQVRRKSSMTCTIAIFQSTPHVGEVSVKNQQ